MYLHGNKRVNHQVSQTVTKNLKMENWLSLLQMLMLIIVF